MPEGLADMSVVLHDMLVSGAEFLRNKQIVDKQWKVTPHQMPGVIAPKSTLFIMHSRPIYQLVDLDRSKRAATEEEIKRYPNSSTNFPPFTTKLVEKAVRLLDIEAKLIGKNAARSRCNNTF